MTCFRLFVLLGLLLELLLGAGGRPATAQTPDTLALATAYRNPARPDTARLASGLALLRAYGSEAALLPRRAALGQRLLAEARRLRRPRLERDALQELHQLAGQTNHPALQLRYTRQLLALARQQRDTVGLVTALEKLSNAYFEAQNMAEALRCAEQADALLRRHPVPALTEATLLARLTNCYLELGQPAQARRTFRRALPATRRAGKRLYEFNLLVTYANGLRLAQPDSALRYLRPALALAQRLADPYALAYVHMVLLQTYKPLGRWPQVQAEARATLRYARLSATPDFEAEALAGLAESLRHLGQGAAAYDTLRRAQTLLDTLQAASTRQELAALQVAAGTERQQARIRTLEQGRRLAAQRQELAALRTRQERAGAGALAGVALLLAGGAFWQYRRRAAAAAAAQATAADTALRQRLAADLHDDVGNLLTQLTMQSGLLRENPLVPVGLFARLDTLNTTARRATQQMSDAIWSLAATAPTLPVLLAHMRDHAYEVFQPLGIEVTFDTHPAVPALPLTVASRQALYLIFKEALHNVVKHAPAATDVRVSLAPAGPGLALAVRNNGPAPAAALRPEGQGLHNMQARAAALGGTVCYPPQATGFAVELMLPR